MIEHSHLKIIQALHQKGTLTEAANALCLSQSALSHQIRYLEKRMEVSLWERDGRNLRLTQAGNLLLETAQQILPVLQQAEQTLKAYGEGRLGVLRIGVECYPCEVWLTTAIGEYLRKMPDVDIDIVNKFQFSGLEGLLNHHIDILLTPDLEKNNTIYHASLANYELVLVVNTNHHLASKIFVLAEDLSQETLLAFPVALERLDILTRFLNPAHVKPQKIKQIASMDLMLQMTALGRGVCVLPQWLANTYHNKLALKTVKLGEQGLHKKLYLCLRPNDKDIHYIQQFIAITQTSASDLSDENQ